MELIRIGQPLRPGFAAIADGELTAIPASPHGSRARAQIETPREISGAFPSALLCVLRVSAVSSSIAPTSRKVA
jgi:hypothetical protein